MEQGKIMEADAPTVRVDATSTELTAPPPPQPPKFFYRPDALSAAQPTASKHWRYFAWLGIELQNCYMLFMHYNTILQLQYKTGRTNNKYNVVKCQVIYLTCQILEPEYAFWPLVDEYAPLHLAHSLQSFLDVAMWSYILLHTPNFYFPERRIVAFLHKGHGLHNNIAVIRMRCKSTELQLSMWTKRRCFQSSLRVAVTTGRIEYRQHTIGYVMCQWKL